jgi:CheY-like chemotaxis protein
VAAGHEVLLALNGLEGLALARAQRPDLILSDLQMPQMDGYALIAALKREPACAAIPTVALTALSMPGDEARMLAAGFDAYLSKPFAPETFEADVMAVLRRHGGGHGE